MGATGNYQDDVLNSYIDSPTRADGTAQEVVSSSTELTNRISTLNSRDAATLASGAVFQGVGEDVSTYGRVGVAIRSDNATDGVLTIEVSQDNVNWGGPPRDWADTRFGQPHMWNIVEKYFRIKYTNGTTEATNLAIQVHYSINADTLLGHQLDETLLDETEAIVVRAVEVGNTPNGLYTNIKRDGYVDAFASSTPLGIGGTFDTGVIDVSGYNYINSELSSDQDGSLVAYFYDDAAGSNLLRTFTKPYAVSEGFSTFGSIMTRPYIRYVYTNGSVAQTRFHYAVKVFNNGLSGQLSGIGDFIPSNIIAPIGRNVIVGLGSDGIYKNVGVNDVGAVETSDFMLDVTRGKYPTYKLNTKYGYNSDIDTGGGSEDVWGPGGLYTGQPVHSASAEAVRVKSSSSNDTSAGTGARTVMIYGLDTDFNEINETITLNGTSNVVSVNSYKRLYRIRTLTAGSGGVNVGTITVRHNVTTANIFAVMPIGINASVIGCVTIPASKTAYVRRLRVSLTRSNGSAGSALVSLLARIEGGVYQALRHENISTNFPLDFALQGGIEVMEKTDLIVRIQSVSDNNSQVAAAFEYLLIDN